MGNDWRALEEHAITILLAEDNAGHARLIEKNLRRANITNKIVKFSDGKSLVNHLANLPEPPPEPVLVLLDLNLPGMSGDRVLAHMKSHRTLKQIPVIILTTTEDPQEIERCYALGCNVYITKPLEYDSFCEAVRRLGFFLSIVKLPQKEL